MSTTDKSWLDDGKVYQERDGRISARISEKLKAAAKANTGITTDSELLRFALARVLTLPELPKHHKKRVKLPD